MIDPVGLGTADQRAMAVSIARRYLRRLPPCFDRLELETVALTGLWEGLRNHPEAPMPYLRVRVTGAIQDELRRQHPLTHNHRQSIKRGEACQVVRASEAEACEQAHSSEDEMLSALHQRRLRRAIEEAPLEERHRGIVRDVLKGQTHRAIAAGLGLTEARISQVCSLSARVLRQHLDRS